MPLLVPFTSDPANTFSCTLGNGVKYVFETRYNDLGGFWTFDLTRDIDQVKLLSGVPILLGLDLLAPYALGAGALIPIDESLAGIDAGPDDLGGRIKVYWLSDDELAQAVAAGP